MADAEWYYCLTHNTVETADGCRSANRFGPYSSRDEAERALQKVAERNEQADAEDARWDGDDE